jgi:malonate-semialdehyde dehydrogenase (acetylating) / methylmalonate-semialdehyde dehydrogenase
MKREKLFIDGEFVESKGTEDYNIFNPSTGEIMAKMPRCTSEEVEMAIKAANDAYPAWSNTPVFKRVEVLRRVVTLMERDLEELTLLVAKEHGKVLEEAKGDVLKAKEATEHACSAPTLMMGDSLMNVGTGIDTVSYKESVGVFAGIAPFNFPAMIPLGWMAPMCLATGNTMVLKISSSTPLTALKIAELYVEAGLPKGVLNMVACSRREAELFLTHKDVKGVSFVGSTSVGKHVYEVAAAHGKRVQALCEAKNHALVLADAPLVRTITGIINASFGCAGERCMALPVVCVEESVADEFVEILLKQLSTKVVGPAFEPKSDLGPLVSADHREFVSNYIEKGVQEGAKLILDGRNIKVEGYENGFYLGHTVFDHVKEGMSIGDYEIFGPVLCIKRVKNFEEGLRIMNNNRFANGSVIFTQNGYYAREFAKRTHGGMVGVNVGIPVPVSVFPFSGHKDSFFGDLHTLGKDGVAFYTETKSVTTKWFDEEESKKTKISTWDN